MIRNIIGVAFLGISITASALAQFADTYRQAAQAFSNAAAQCQSPSGAACLRQNASHYSCLANQLGGGGSCGSAPSCSTSCTGSGSGGGSAGSSGAGLTQKQQLALTGLNLAIQWLGNRHHNDGAGQPNDADIAAANAQAQAAIAEANAAFSNEVALRNALTSGADPSTVGNTPGQSSEDPTVALRNQFTSANADSGSNQLIASNSPPPVSTSTATGSGDGSASSADANATPNPSGSSGGTPSTPSEPTPDPSLTQPVPGYASPINQQAIQAAMAPSPTSPMNSVYQQSSDDSSADTPSVADNVMNSIKAIPGEIKDGLDSVMADVSSVKTSLTNLWNDPSVQFMNQIRSGDYTTISTPTTTDTPDQAVNKTFGQAVVGFGDFKDGFYPGLKSYGEKMVNQMEGFLGLAQAQITPGDSQ